MLTDWLIYLDYLEDYNCNTIFLRLITPIIFGIIEYRYCNYTKGDGYGYGFGDGNSYSSEYGYNSEYGYSYDHGYGSGDGNGDGNGYSNPYDEEH